MLSPSEAADAVQKSKSAILRSIKKGRLSASLDDNGHYQIDPSELARVYEIIPEDKRKAPSPSGASAPARGAPRDTKAVLHEVEILLEKVEAERAERARERRMAQDVIDDLRARLDREGEERRMLMARLLTDERPAEKRGLFWRKKKTA